MSPRHVDTCPFCGGPDYVPHEVIECGKAKLREARERCEKAEAVVEAARVLTERRIQHGRDAAAENDLFDALAAYYAGACPNTVFHLNLEQGIETGRCDHCGAGPEDK